MYYIQGHIQLGMWNPQVVIPQEMAVGTGGIYNLHPNTSCV